MSSHYTALCRLRSDFKLSILSLLLCFFSSIIHAKPATIVVSIKPLHSLVSQITDGVNQPKLLLQQQQSPHHFQLRPSQKRLINQADIFFYSSDHLESFVPALKNTNRHLTFVELSQISKLNTLAARSLHAHNTHSHANNIDAHIWLSVENAKIISIYVTSILSEKSPEYAERYHQNLKVLLKKLQTLKQQNQQLLSPFSATHFLVYHDAFQYFERENNLGHAHFVSINPEHSPGIKRVQALRKLIHTENIQCIFYETPNIPALLHTLTENTSLQLAAIDPAGAHIPAGQSHYFQLMQQTATTLKECFSNQ